MSTGKMPLVFAELIHAVCERDRAYFEALGVAAEVCVEIPL
jgi:hypothetical protein